MTQFTSVDNRSNSQQNTTNAPPPNTTEEDPSNMADKVSGVNSIKEPLLKAPERVPTVNIVTFENDDKTDDHLSHRRSTPDASSPVDIRPNVRTKRYSLAIPQVNEMRMWWMK